MSMLQIVRLRRLALLTAVGFLAACGPQLTDPLSTNGKLSANGDPQIQGEPKEEEGPPLEWVDAPDEEQLTEESAEQIAAPFPNPYGCFGRSDRPHRSTHIPANVSAQGNTICAVPVPWIFARSSLYRSRAFWFDEHISTTQLGRSGTNVQVNPGGRCVNTGNYYITSYHEVRGPDGRLYWARTSNSAFVDCR